MHQDKTIFYVLDDFIIIMLGFNSNAHININCRYERFVMALEDAVKDMLPNLKDKAMKVSSSCVIFYLCENLCTSHIVPESMGMRNRVKERGTLLERFLHGWFENVPAYSGRGREGQCLQPRFL